MTPTFTKEDTLNVHKQAFGQGNFRGIVEMRKDGVIVKHEKLEHFLSDIWRFIHGGDFTDDSFEALFGGGAGGGKSFGMCYFFLMMSECYPDTVYAIVREELKQLRESTYITMGKVVKYLNFPDKMYNFNGQDNHLTFRNGSRIYLKDGGYKPSDPEYDRWGSTEFTGAWIEEGQQVGIQAKEAIQTRTGRAKNETYNIPAFLIVTGNPGKNWMYTQFYKPAQEGKLPVYRFFYPALVHDNPFIAKSYIKNLQKLPESSTRKQRQYYGNWEFDDDPTALVEYTKIMDMFSLYVGKTGEKFLICDAARDGGDKITAFVFDGLQLIEMKYWSREKTDVSAKKLKKLMMKHGIPASRVLVDVNGVGGGLADQLPDGIVEFINNARALDDENYKSLKDQCGYILAQYINAGKIGMMGIDLPEEVKEQIIEEMEWLKSYEDDKGGKARLLPKDKIKEAIGRSPDFLDTFLMRMYFEIKKKTSIIKTETMMNNVLPFEPNPSIFVDCAWYVGEDNNISVWMYQRERMGDIRIIEYLEEQITTPADFMFAFQSKVRDNRYIINRNYFYFINIDASKVDPKADVFRLLKKLGLTSSQIMGRVQEGEARMLVRSYFHTFLFRNPHTLDGYYKIKDDSELEQPATKAFIALIQSATLRDKDAMNVPVNSMRDVKRLLHSDNPRDVRKGRMLERRSK